MPTAPKYDQYNRPTDGTRKDWMLTRPHGRGQFRYQTREEAEFHARRIAAQEKEPVIVWAAVAEYEIYDPPVKRTALNPEFFDETEQIVE